ncbi:MAG: glycosyltransferase family 2 protein [Candidatus Pacearchaeota archaeon]|nr:glycosyltransferase family 2 protein [Candidatus Pacearchaeota archaeon]
MALFPQLPMWVLYPILFVGFFIAIFYLLIFFKKEQKIARSNIFPDIIFLIPAKNVQEVLKECVKRIVNQNYRGKIFTIIINDASTDNTINVAKELIRKYSKEQRKIILLNREKSTGYKSHVLNFGLKYLFSKKELLKKSLLIAHLDADTFIPKNLIKEAVPFFQDESVMAVTSWMMPHNEKKFFARMQKIEYLMTSFYRYLLGRVDAVCIAPAFTVFRAEFFKKAGYYDEKTLTEDFEIALRVKSFGCNIVFLDKKITTIIPENFNKLRKERIRWWHGTLQNMIKYKHLVSPKYGALGTFFLPVTVILGTAIMLAAALIVLYSLISNSYNLIHDLLLGVFPKFDFKLSSFNTLLFLSDPRIILSIFALLLSVLFFSFAIAKLEEKIKFWDYIIFIFFYGWLLILFCLEGVIKYIFKLKVSW